MPKISERLQKYDAIFYNLFHYRDKTIIGMFDETIRKELYRQHYRLCDKDSYTPELEEKIDALLELFPGHYFRGCYDEGRVFQCGFVFRIPELNRKILQYRYEHLPSLTFAEIGRRLGMTGENAKYHFNKTIDLYEKYLSGEFIGSVEDELEDLRDILYGRHDDFLNAAVSEYEKAYKSRHCANGKFDNTKQVSNHTKHQVKFIKNLLATHVENEATRVYREKLELIWAEACDREWYEKDRETIRKLLAKRDELCTYLRHQIPDELKRVRAYYNEFSEYATKLFERRRIIVDPSQLSFSFEDSPP